MQKKNKNKFKSFVKKNKIISIIVALFLFIGIATPITYAYLQDRTSEVTNIFTPGSVTTEIKEEPFDGNEKKYVKIKNTGNVAAYIRAAIIVNWVDDAGNISGEPPVEDNDYVILLNNNDWLHHNDGYYYHKAPVAPDDFTSVLIESARPLVDKEGYTLSIEILASGIQSEGVDGNGKPPVQEAWSIAVGADGHLGGSTP